MHWNVTWGPRKGGGGGGERENGEGEGLLNQSNEFGDNAARGERCHITSLLL